MRTWSWGVAVILAVSIASEATAQTKSCCRGGEPTPWKGYNRGVEWFRTLESAVAVARRTGRPILYHVLVGDMDKEGT